MSNEAIPTPPQILMLPCDGLVVPDWNPRKFMERGPLLDLMAHIKAGGKVLRILVWGGDGKSVISGQRRLLAYRRLGKTHIEAEILDISLEEARKIAITSNEGEPLYWLDRYESWEPYWTEDSGFTEDEVGAKVGAAASWISRAKALLGVLSPAGRRMIREKLEEYSSQEDIENKGNNGFAQTLGKGQKTLKKRISENSGKWLLVEDVAFQLTAFWDKCSLADAQAQVEKAMPVILSRQMNGPQVKALVEAMKGGTPAQAYVPAPPQKRAPKAKTTPAAQVPVGAGAPVANAPAQIAPTPQPMATPMPTPFVPNPAPAPQTSGVWSLVWGILLKELEGKAGRAFHRVAGIFLKLAQPGRGPRLEASTQVFTRRPGWAHSLAARVQKLGAKDLVWTVFLAAGLILLVVNFLLHQATRLLTHALFRPAYSGANTASPTYIQPPASQPSLSTQRESNGPALGDPRESNGPVREPQRMVASKPKPSTPNPTLGQAPVGLSNPSKDSAPVSTAPAALAAHKPQVSILNNQLVNKATGENGTGTQSPAVAAAPKPAPALSGAPGQAGKPQGQDVFKQIGNGLNILSNGASAVNNTASAVDQARSFLGIK